MSNSISNDTLLVQLRALATQAQGKALGVQQTPVAGQAEFSALLKGAVSAVNQQQQQAESLVTAFQKGDPNVQLSEVMLSMQKASLSFQAMVEVRNKLVSAYHDIMSMQI